MTQRADIGAGRRPSHIKTSQTQPETQQAVIGAGRRPSHIKTSQLQPVDTPVTQWAVIDSCQEAPSTHNREKKSGEEAAEEPVNCQEHR